jgi:hypothetical protein
MFSDMIKEAELETKLFNIIRADWKVDIEKPWARHGRTGSHHGKTGTMKLLALTWMILRDSITSGFAIADRSTTRGLLKWNPGDGNMKATNLSLWA